MDIEEEYAFDILLKIPPEHAHRILDASVPISTLLQHPCPPLSGALALVRASELFTQLELRRRLDALLREVNKPSEGTGSDRLFRWTGAPSGNTANAALAAGQRADRVNSFLFAWCVH
jgi:hypothetical protein